MVHCGCYSEKFDCGDKRYNQIKENLSVSYLSAVCTFIGAELQSSGRTMDNAGYDATITLPPDRHNRNIPWRIDAQLKCTSSPKYNPEGYLLFQINIDIYKSMIEAKTTPFILFVLVVPEDVDTWVTCNTDELIMRNNMYWIDGSGYSGKIKDGQEQVQMKIPPSNIVTEESLYNLLYRGNGE